MLESFCLAGFSIRIEGKSVLCRPLASRTPQLFYLKCMDRGQCLHNNEVLQYLWMLGWYFSLSEVKEVTYSCSLGIRISDLQPVAHTIENLIFLNKKLQHFFLQTQWLVPSCGSTGSQTQVKHLFLAFCCFLSLLQGSWLFCPSKNICVGNGSVYVVTLILSSFLNKSAS